jgi:hypothetical protein
VLDNGTVMVKGEDGAVVPPRRCTAPAHFCVTWGGLTFDRDEAAAEQRVNEPVGAIEGAMVHVGETVYLANCTGAILGLAADGRTVQRVVDGLAIQGLLRTKHLAS